MGFTYIIILIVQIEFLRFLDYYITLVVCSLTGFERVVYSTTMPTQPEFRLHFVYYLRDGKFYRATAMVENIIEMLRLINDPHLNIRGAGVVDSEEDERLAEKYRDYEIFHVRM